MSKRSASAAAAAAATADGKEPFDIMKSEYASKILPQQLRQAKVRLAESRATIDELRQLNEDHTHELQQMRRYCRRVEEGWTAMEEAMRTILHTLPNAAAALKKPVDAKGASSSSSSDIVIEPVVSMFAHRWSQLSGQPATAMQAAGAKALTTVKAETDSDAMDDVEQKGEEDSSETTTAVANEKLDEQFQSQLQQRTAFTQRMLQSLVDALQQRPPPPPTSTDAEQQLAYLQSECLSLRAKLHSTANEVIVLTTTVHEQQEKLEKSEDERKAIQRKYERLKIDFESGGGAAVKTEADSSPSASSQAGAITFANGVVKSGFPTTAAAAVPDTRPFSPTSLRTLSVAPALAAALPPPKAMSVLELRKLQEDKREHEYLAKERLGEAKELRLKLSDAERRLKSAEMDFLQNSKLIESSHVFQQLRNWSRVCKSERDAALADNERLKLRNEELSQRCEKLEADSRRAFARSQEAFEASSDTRDATISQLQTAVVALTHERDELQLALNPANATHPDHAFFQTLRTQLIPYLDQTLKQQQKQLQDQKTELDAARRQLADKAEFGRVVRYFQQTERKLKAEIEALQSQRPSSSSQQPSSTSSSSSAATSSPDLATTVATLQKENQMLQSRIDELQSSDTAALQEEVDTLKATVDAIGADLNDLSAAAETAASTAATHAQQVIENTKALTALRSEKVIVTRTLQQTRQENQIVKASADAMQHTLKTQQTAYAALQQRLDALEKQLAKTNEQSRVLQEAYDAEKKTAADMSVQAADVRGQLAELTKVHSTCQSRIQELQEREAEAAGAVCKAKEARVLLERKIKILQENVGGFSGSSVSEAEARIQTLKQLVQCSVCQTNNKDVVITKCMHAFCRECTQKNLDTRLRKCPRCGVKFGDGDMKPLYL